MSNFSGFMEIRKEYAHVLPFWMADYEATGNMCQDPYFMNWIFTPIEHNVWCDIRCLGIPFYPQVPALNYFLDFACPMLKIGIECDGKAWHDYELDKARDARLAADGWMIFRIEGHECKRVIYPWEEGEEDRDELVDKYFMATSEGVMSAIKSRYFDDEYTGKYSSLIENTLFQHRSTPETFPVRKPIDRTAEPVHIADSLESYIYQIMIRQKAAA